MIKYLGDNRCSGLGRSNESRAHMYYALTAGGLMCRKVIGRVSRPVYQASPSEASSGYKAASMPNVWAGYFGLAQPNHLRHH